ncbi:MAG: 3-deoxy-D-manno-octulosonic acid transferase, partial [Planctomycetota bacterium]
VSVGEVNAAKTLIAELQKQLPRYEIALSSTTDTGMARATAVYGGELDVFYFPFDLSGIMKRAFKRIRPRICLLMELEVWPNLARIAAKQNIPLVVVNGRLSDKSFPRYKLVRPMVKSMFAKISLVLAQTEEYAQRFRFLGCPEDKVIVTSSLKYDTARITERIEGADKIAAQLNIGNDRLWVAGGTGPGEERIILDVFGKLRAEEQFSDLRLAVVPRKPERFDEVAALIERCGFDFARYGAVKDTDETIEGNPSVILGDTMGDLRRFYSLANIVFVGRSLVPMGGSDMMEPTAMGKCTIFGPHTFNFRQTVDALLQANGAIEVTNGEELLTIMRKCLADRDSARSIAGAGQEVIKQNQGATQRTVDAIIKLLAK